MSNLETQFFRDINNSSIAKRRKNQDIITITRSVPTGENDCHLCDFCQESMLGKGICYIFQQCLESVGKEVSFAGNMFVEKKYKKCKQCKDNIVRTARYQREAASRGKK